MNIIEYIGNLNPGAVVSITLLVISAGLLIWSYTPKGKKWIQDN